MNRSEYGKDRDRQEITAPTGWRIVPEGESIPQIHREFIHSHDRRGLWAEPRRCHSTMTPMHARIWGDVFAFATPDTVEQS